MKNTIIFSFLFIGNISFGQEDINLKADTSNYYDFYSKGKNSNLATPFVSTDWLRLNDVVPILMEELKNAGYDWLYDYCLFKVDSVHYIVLSAYSRKSNFGFLYIEGHDMFPSINHRKDMTMKSNNGVEYISCEETPSGHPNFIRISKLPENIFPLNENNYWFQYTSIPQDSKLLITRETAIRILRQDIKMYLSKAPKPKK